MEFDTPSRFINDIDPHLLTIEGDEDVPENFFGRRNEGGFFGRNERTSSGGFYESRNDRQQNSRPVASQFRADPKPRIVQHREESRVDPFSERFKRTYAQTGGNLRRLSDAVKSPSPASPGARLSEGNVIEHERFGIGDVLKVEGSGENTKATVQFRNAGTKQLLLKFARYKVIG
jgi:DNA helicase-2/ATP-dependent DNA helicase PcrA